MSAIHQPILSFLTLAAVLAATMGPAYAATKSSSAKETAAHETTVQASPTSPPASANTVDLKAHPIKNHDLPTYCYDTLKGFPGPMSDKDLRAACQQVEMLEGCQSVEGSLIYHYNRAGTHKANQRILVYSLIHGDETPAGSVGRLWMERLQGIDPRNTWRVIPILNPDGVKLKTRTNANKVDLNRNFPTKDWDEKAKSYWMKAQNSNPRRFPGEQSASEPELKCALKHIEDFKPDFVVSIHTPLKVLDFDGPKVKPPKFDYLPWKSLGNYPGSLGRYLWHERNTPVLTMELREDLPKSAGPFVQLQDVIGLLVSLEESKNSKRLSDESVSQDKASQ